MATEVAMADVFISHAAADSPFAEFLHRHLTQEGLSVYLASVSMPPGERWMPHIMDNLRSSTWVLCLASRTACASPWVMQEMGAAVAGNKKLVPIIWDQQPDALPGNTKRSILRDSIKRKPGRPLAASRKRSRLKSRKGL
jgi:TIR domain